MPCTAVAHTPKSLRHPLSFAPSYAVARLRCLSRLYQTPRLVSDQTTQRSRSVLCSMGRPWRPRAIQIAQDRPCQGVIRGETIVSLRLVSHSRGAPAEFLERATACTPIHDPLCPERPKASYFRPSSFSQPSSTSCACDHEGITTVFCTSNSATQALTSTPSLLDGLTFIVEVSSITLL